MGSGLQTLHDIDRAIAKARGSMSEASALPARIGSSLAEIRRQQAAAFDQISAARLEIIEHGQGGDLGYVDRQAEKLLKAHDAEERKIEQDVQESLNRIEKLEAERRTQEKLVAKAVDAYDKKAAAVELKILDNPAYQAQLENVETAEFTVIRAKEKLAIAREDEQEKGRQYLTDPFFSYLQRRQYGTKDAKGWFLTKALDSWVARLCNYTDAASNYRRLVAIPQRIENHVARLEAGVVDAQDSLHDLESDILEREGVNDLRDTSISAQNKLEQIDNQISDAEDTHQALRDQQVQITSGQTGPYREAINLLSDVLSRQDIRALKRIAAQTQTRDDEQAIETLRDLSKAVDDLEDDQSEAQKLLKKYQRSLRELEQVRRRFKSRRFDAPSSVFSGSELIQALLLQVVNGALSGDDFWRQILKAQRTIRRYSDSDFGGGVWTEGLRLPRSSGGWGGSFPSGGGWGGVSRRRTSIPRTPRRSLPKVSLPSGGSRRGGFRTGGGF